MREYDVVIVGSGAGGGAVAKELAPLATQGKRIAVLEWGPRLSDDEFVGREVDMARRLYFDAGGFLTRDRSMTLALGKLYGGSTVVYTGTSLVIRPEIVHRWGVPGLDWADVAARAEKYKGENSVHLLPPEEVNDNNRLFLEGCRKLDFHVEQFPINVKGCLGSGLCNLGCPNQAKQGTHRVQLPAAERSGVEVVTRCEVVRIHDDRTIDVVVHPREDFGREPEWAPGPHRIRAKAVVVSAGAVNSPALLLRSRVARDLPALGRYFTCHPALILVAEHGRPITNYHGHPKSYYCDEFEESHRFLLETCMYFPFTTAKNLAGFGEQAASMLSRFDRLQMILVLALDDALAENRVTIDRKGAAIVDYRITEPVIESLLASMRASARIFFAAGAVRVHAPAGERFFLVPEDDRRLHQAIGREHFQLGRISISAAHLMGGCRMGESPETSVTNAWGEVHGVPWLFVADASLFPQAADINPYLTIMALSDRVAQRVREKLPHLS